MSLVATHNLESVLNALECLKQDNKTEKVFFGQLNGMADQISLALAESGQKCLKLVPTGTVSDVLPWLARRMQENSVALDRAEWDRQLIRKELKRRVFGI